MKTKFQEGQSDLFGILDPPPPPPPPKPKSDRTPEEAIQEIIDIGWTIEHEWISQLYDLDELPDGIDRVFIITKTPRDELIALVFDDESGNFFTQIELGEYLYDKSGN